MIRKALLLFSTSLVVVSLAACGGNGASSPSPAAPSGANPTPSISGATIAGLVNGLVRGSGAGLLGARDVTTVTATVGGVTVTANIDGEGNFVITGLPAGTVTLSFTGTSATVTVENVGQSDNIRIVVTISGGTATVETEERTVDGTVELEGRISELGMEGTRTFYVGDTLVTVADLAIVRHGETPVDLATLRVGDRVHVRGVPGTLPNSVNADLVIVQSTNAKVPANLKGAVSELLGGSCPAIEFKVGSWTVATSLATTYSKGKSCTDLAVGAAVHVKGDIVEGKVQAKTVQFDK